MKKIVKAGFVLFVCYLCFFLFQYRQAISIALFEEHGQFHEKYNPYFPIAKGATNYLEGYAGSNSVFPGNIIEIFISTNQKKVMGSLIRWGAQSKAFKKSEISGTLIKELGEIGGNRIFLRVKDGWKPGIYMVKLKAQSGMKTNIIFVVRPRILGSFSSTAVVLATNTWQAYNSYPKNTRFPSGGFDCPVPYGSVDTVTFNRPYNASTKPGYAGLPYAFYNYVASLVHFLEKHHYRCEYLTEDDIWDKGMVLPYKTLIFGDHTEYIRVYEQDNIARFLKSGNNVIYANGGSFYAQVKAIDDGRSIKLMWDGKNIDTSLFGNKNHVPYGRFYPASKITGVSFRDNAAYIKPFFLEYNVVNSTHWIYGKTGLKEGDKFGLFGGKRDTVGEYSPKNIEILAVASWGEDDYIRHFIYKSPKERLPLTFRVGETVFDLAKIFIKQFIPLSFLEKNREVEKVLRGSMIKPPQSELLSGNMLYYKNSTGGRVFSTGTSHWNWNMVPMDTLKENTVMSQIFHNVLERFAVPKER